MNKTLSKILVWINIAVVLLLIISSVLILSVTNNQKGGVFGYNVKLVVGEKLDNEIGERCLIFVKQADKAKLAKGSYLLCSDDGISNIIKTDTIDGNIVSYTGKDGEKLTLDISSQDYCGIVTFSSNFLGNLVSTFAKAESVSLTFLFIGGIFVISMLSLAIIYALHMRKKSHIDSSDIEENDEYTLPDESEENQDNYIFDESSMLNPIDADEYDNSLDGTPNTINKATSSLNDFNCEVADEITIADLATQRNNQSVTPLYSLSDDDIPSIEELMKSIDAQFLLTNQDDDEMFSTKK